MRTTFCTSVLIWCTKPELHCPCSFRPKLLAQCLRHSRLQLKISILAWRITTRVYWQPAIVTISLQPSCATLSGFHCIIQTWVRRIQGQTSLANCSVTIFGWHFLCNVRLAGAREHLGAHDSSPESGPDLSTPLRQVCAIIQGHILCTTQESQHEGWVHSKSLTWTTCSSLILLDTGEQLARGRTSVSEQGKEEHLLSLLPKHDHWNNFFGWHISKGSSTVRRLVSHGSTSQSWFTKLMFHLSRCKPQSHVREKC